MDTGKFRSLSGRQRALVAVAVLLDGREAAAYLNNDALNGAELGEAAMELAKQAPELRMPYIGSMLRMALGDLK